MKVPFNPTVFSATMLAACALATMILVPGARAQMRPTQGQEFPNFDKRVRAELNAAESAQREQGQAHLKGQLPSADVSFDALLDTPKFVRARNGFLTGPDGQGLAVSSPTARAIPSNDPYGPVKGFLNEHSALFGHGAGVLTNAKVTRESVGAHNGLRTVVWQQQLDGISVFDAVLIGNITKRGELVTLASQFLPNPVQGADTGTPNRATLQARQPVSIEQAIVNGAQNIGDSLSLSEILPGNPATAGDGYQLFKVRNTVAYGRLVWLPMNRAALRLSWEVFVSRQTTRESFQILIDAETGEALVRRGQTKHISDATYNVYTSDSPSPFSPCWPTPNNAQPPLTNRVLVTLPALDMTASPNGWIDDGNNETRGNNTDTFLDRDFDGQPDGGQRPQGNPPRVFDFPLDLTQDPIAYTNAATVQMFYWVNWYHDRLYQLGFTESAGNYQNNNFGRGGLGGDEIISYVQAGADLGFADNAFFVPAPDGISGQIAMFIFDFPNPQRDGDLDAEVIMHEATHGTSWRLVGGGVGISALQTDGMGEGWSDFAELSLLSEPSDDPDAAYAEGGYVTRVFAGLQENYYFGIRHFPYSTDMSKNPFTFKDIDPTQISAHAGVPRSPIMPFNTAEADEVHHQGEIWCVTLWDARANLVRKDGYAGNQLILQLVIDGMKLGPANPTFLQARDAIILADLVNNGGANVGELWAAFAKRGMGFSAIAPDSSTTVGVVEAYDVPGVNVVGVNVSGGNGNGVIDINECNDLQIILANFNTFAVTGLRLSLSTRTPGVALGVRSSDYPDLASLALGTNLVPFTISTAPFFICGTPITLQALIKSDQETRTNTIVLNTGTIGNPIRFNSAGPVAIPDNNAVGTNSPIVVSNITSALREVSVSLFLTHTFDFDLRLELIGPDGTTVVLSDSHGGSGDNYGAGCAPEPFRTTFDDDGVIPIGTAFPPFVGTFRPDEALSAFGGKFGTNVNGTWRLHVVDQFRFDVGVVQCWSLFLSPAACEDGGGTCPGGDLALGITDTPDPVFIGSNLVYTVSVTNNGPSAATNVVITQFLPIPVVFVSAVSSQGTVTPAGGTVIGNLGVVSITGVATMTVTVTPILPAPATIVSSATVSSINSDPDTSNNSASTTTQVNPATSDLAVGIFDAPDPALVGGTLTYTISVTNNGPSTASGVTVTNTLPLSVFVNSVTPSQGSTINGNIVVCGFGTLTNGGRASVAINVTVTPTAQDTIVATAVVKGNQVDPIAGNNTATATTTVGPAAELSIAMIDTPDPVVVRSNWTYIITVTNHGPNIASGVVMNQTLPANVSVVSSNTTQGTISLAGNVITASLGSLTNGGSATIRNVVNATSSGVYSSTATVTGSQGDPNTANNSALALTTVAPPNVAIVPDGAKLTSESPFPPNGALDIGETVTVELGLRNAGNVPTGTDVVATLLTNGGVTPLVLNSPVNYGILTNGFNNSRPFTFTASGTNGGTVVATLQLQVGGTILPSVSFTFALPNVRTIADPSRISITDNQPIPWPAGPAAPYPSTINVSGVTGLVSKVTVTLSNLNHSFPDDVDMLLVGPGGQKVLLMSDVGGADAVTNAIVTFDDAAPGQMPDSGQILSTSYKPTDYEPEQDDAFDAPAPARPYGTSLSAFAGASANGDWSLYIMDDSTGDPGSITRGWSLAVTTLSPIRRLADVAVSVVDSPDPVLVGNTLTYTFAITNKGPDTASAVALTNILPGTVSFVSALPANSYTLAGSVLTFTNLGNLNTGAQFTVAIVVQPLVAGSLSSTGWVSATDVDLNTANNSVSTVSTVVDLAITNLASPDPVSPGNNLTNTIFVTNKGLSDVTNVQVTDLLPAGVNFVSTQPAGTATNAGGTVTWSIGTLAANTSVTNTIVVVPTVPGTITNTAVVTAGSGSGKSASTITIVNPVPIIRAAGEFLLADNPNATVNLGETVTVLLALENVGSADTASLIATLLDSGGVSAPSGPQNYGVLATNAASKRNLFTFTAIGFGTVFKVDTNSTLTTLVSFNNTNGANPYARLVQGTDSNFYGTTYRGGTNGGFGTVFRMDTNGTLTPLVSFNNTNGANPYAGLVQGRDGSFYGTTVSGGTNGGFGTVFKITTNGAFSTLVSFANTNGANPHAGLVQGTDGSFYGTTISGGTNGGFGTVFKVDTNGTLTTLVSFNNTNGANPYAGLVLGADGNFYGTTVSGGTNGGFGTVFRVDTNGALTTLDSFTNTNGANPYAGLVQGTDGNFHGTTYRGGLSGLGTIFKVTTNGALTTLLSFNNANGANPYAGLVQGTDGSFYGTTLSRDAVIATLQLWDGTNDLGTVAFTFHFPTTIAFSNTAAITIPDHGGATPYPSTIKVSGVTGLVRKVTVTLSNMTHGFPDDLDILLVNPTGRKLVLMSDAGGGHTISNRTLIFDDAGPALPDSAAIVTGTDIVFTYAPTDYEPGEPFPPPAPTGALGSSFAVFNGTDPLGTWSLYVVDDFTGDAGSIAGGWSLSLSVVDTTVIVLPITLSSAVVTNGQFQMILTGIPQLSYVIQASADLVTWVSVGTYTAAANGTFKFTDPNAPNFSLRFYRAVRLIP